MEEEQRPTGSGKRKNDDDDSPNKRLRTEEFSRVESLPIRLPVPEDQTTPFSNSIPGLLPHNDVRKRLCSICNSRFPTIFQLQQHIYNNHSSEVEQHVADIAAAQQYFPRQLQLTRSTLNGTYISYEADLNQVVIKNPDLLFLSYKDSFFRLVNNKLAKDKVVKLQFDIELQFSHETPNVELEHFFIPMESFIFLVENPFRAEHVYNLAREHYNERVDEFTELGSGHILEKVVKFRVMFLKTDSLIGGGKQTLPPILQKKYRSLVSPPGEDGFCFKRAVIAGLHGKDLQTKNKNRTLERTQFYEQYMDSAEINWTGINFPFSVSQVDLFHKNNPSIGLNILCYDENIEDITVKDFESENDSSDEEEAGFTGINLKDRHKEIKKHTYPLSICREDREHVIDLLLVINGDEAHFCWISSLVGFLKNPDRSDVQDICRFCLQSFGSTYNTHVKYCAALEKQQTKFPEEDYLRFNKYKYTIKLPFVVYADFESVLEPVAVTKGSTLLKQQHKPSAFSWALVDHQGNLINTDTYIAKDEKDDVMSVFLGQMIALSDETKEICRGYQKEAYKQESLQNIPLPNEEVECGFCKLSVKPNEVVRHHSHLPPYQFEWYSHRRCNALASLSSELHCFMHNMTSYDGRLITIAAAKKDLVAEVDVIGKSAEKFMAIRVNKNLLFLDSLSFFQASLDSIVESMDKTKHFDILRQHFGKNYDHSTKECSDADYQFTRKVWQAFNMKNLRDFTKVYVESDVMLLACAFEKMRAFFYEHFTLDPAHYYSISQLSWDCCFKHTNCSLEIVKDPTLQAFFELSIRGGISMGGSRKHAEANNEYMGDLYNPEKETSYLAYYDINARYPYSLCSSLPTHDLKFVTQEQLAYIQKDPYSFILELNDEDTEGFFFDIDAYFPPECHDTFKDMCIAPYKRSVDYSELSSTQKEFAAGLGVTTGAISTPKLMCDLLPRKDYKVHGLTLKYYLQLGMKISAVNNAVSFKQSPVFRPYIQFLAEKRKESKSKVDSNFFKLASNSVYGKAIENLRKRSTFKVIRSEEEALRYNRKPTISRVIILDTEDGNDLVIVCLKRLSVTLSRPTYVGAACLDLSKRHYFSFYFDYLVPTFGKDSISTLLIDTDSIIAHLRTPKNPYKEMIDLDGKWFDCSAFSPIHPIWKEFYSNKYNKIYGLMKDECANSVMTECVFLRSKSYAYQYTKEDNGESTLENVRKCKGINRVAMQNQVKFEQYKTCLERPIQYENTAVSIIGKKHHIYTVETRKRGLACFDTKRFLLKDGVTTVPYGYYGIQNGTCD